MSPRRLEKLHRSELEAIVVSQSKLIERFRQRVSLMSRETEDEGDRVYFGSTNDADDLAQLASELEDDDNFLECQWMHGHDLYADLKVLRSAILEARNALHQHYVAWDGEPEDATALQAARANCDTAIAATDGP